MSNKKFLISGLLLILSCIGIISYLSITASAKEAQYLETISFDKAAEISKTGSNIIVIGRASCSHCVEYKPQISKYAETQKTKVYYVDLDQSENARKFLKYPQFTLTGTPTTFFFKEGKNLHTIEGYVNADMLGEQVEKAKALGFEINTTKG